MLSCLLFWLLHFLFILHPLSVLQLPLQLQNAKLVGRVGDDVLELEVVLRGLVVRGGDERCRVKGGVVIRRAGQFPRFLELQAEFVNYRVARVDGIRFGVAEILVSRQHSFDH